MVELFFILYVLPKRMSRLARERDRSAVGWSLIAISAWLGAEIAVGVIYGIIHGIGEAAWGWSERSSAGVIFILYLVSLAAAIGSAEFVRWILFSMPKRGVFSPPPPPRF